MPTCPLCAETAVNFFTDDKSDKQFFHCQKCDLRFLNPVSRLDRQEEFNRYLQHNNKVDDPAYQNFVRPLYELIRKWITPDKKGLDFGCGSGPVLTHLLKNDGYDIKLYDPFFYPESEALNQKYDLIFAVEVAEHFFDPGEEFPRLKRMLNDGGSLVVMTSFYDENTDFKSWGYRQDPTHVVFYSDKTFAWIQAHFNFRSYSRQSHRIAWFEC